MTTKEKVNDDDQNQQYENARSKWNNETNNRHRKDNNKKNEKLILGAADIDNDTATKHRRGE